MRTLHRKLLRDFAALKGQSAAIAVVIACGVMTLVLSVTNLDAIQLSQQRFYQDYRFADVFADLTRAPDVLAARIGEIPGVNVVETRVRAPVRLEVPGFPDPVRGQLISIPDGRQPELNRLHLRAGALPESGRADQVAISEPFAEAHGLGPGDRIRAIINGRLETLAITGVALSPEWIYQIGPADLMPDYERFAVLWMNHRALAHAFDMDGAFNNVVLTLQAGALAAPVIDALDELLAPYGGIGAHDRDDQMSHRFLSEEIDQLRVMAVVLPAIFMGVSAFLLSVLMGRIVHTQRQQIAVLKAFGYANRDMATHYGLLTGAIVLIGAAAGTLLGAWVADALAGLYMEYFRFPEMHFRVRPQAVALGIAVAGAAAMLGTFRAVSRAVRMAPAEAMRPPTPETFRGGGLEHSALGRLLGQPTRIILRNLARHRVKAALSVLGIGLSAALLVLGSFQFGALDRLIDTQYRLVQKSDLVVHFTDPTPERALAELRHRPGVRFAEGFRNAPVTLRNGLAEYRTSIQGMDARPRLRGLIDAELRDIELPPEGLMLTDYLAEHLGARPGERIEVEVMEGHRRTLGIHLAGTVSEPLGVSAYMERRALNRLLREGPAINGAWLLTDAKLQTELYDSLWELPRVAGIGLIGDAERQIRDYIETTVLAFMAVLLLLAGSIAFAVVYNNARIAFAERERELATLRVLGFSRGEAAWVLIGEIALVTLVAIPAGWAMGTGLAWLLSEALTMDLYRIPFIITHQTYAFAALGVVAASALSLALIARRLVRLDMVTALKTLE